MDQTGDNRQCIRLDTYSFPKHTERHPRMVASTIPESSFQHYEMGTSSISKHAESRLGLVDRGIKPPSSPFDWPVLRSRWDFPITEGPHTEAAEE